MSSSSDVVYLKGNIFGRILKFHCHSFNTHRVKGGGGGEGGVGENLPPLQSEETKKGKARSEQDIKICMHI